MESRLTSGTGDARKIKAAAASLAEGLPTASVLGDVDALAARLTTIIEHADTAAAADKAKREEHRAAQTARKEALAAEAEEVALNSTQWKSAGDRLREILEEWRTISGLDRKTDDALWKRYSAAREAFNRRRGSHFADLDRERAGARQAKEALCERAEELADSTDWGPTAAAFRDLLAEWKAAGRASKDVDDALWQRFKAAQDTFFSARNALSRRARRRVPARTRTPSRRCWRRRRRSTPATWTPHAPPCARSATSGTRSARCPASSSADLERRLRAIEKKVRDAPSHTASIPRPRHVPTNSASAQNNSSGRRRRPRRRAAPKTPSRHGPAPSNGGNGPKPRPRRSARGARPSPGPSASCRRRSCPVAPWSGVSRRPCDAPLQRRAAARCAPTPPSPSCRSARSR